MVYLNTYGDGVVKAAHIVCNLLADDSQIVLIDEMENGLHTKYQDHLWKSVLTLLKEYNTQLFITTHSYEIVKRLFILSKQEKNENLISIFRLQKDRRNRDRNNDLEVIQYSGSKLEHTLEGEFEFR